MGKPTRICEVCEGPLATVHYEDMELCADCYNDLQEAIERNCADTPCRNCNGVECHECEFNAENQPPYDDGQPSEQDEWRDYDPDC